MEEDILICDCSSNEHQIVLRHDKEDNMVYCSVHLQNHSFFKRLLTAIKYIFGYKSVYGDWEEFIFKPEHINKLKEVIKTLEK
jgi:hypothetical protein